MFHTSTNSTKTPLATENIRMAGTLNNEGVGVKGIAAHIVFL
jgi:hypothetical protein